MRLSSLANASRKKENVIDTTEPGDIDRRCGVDQVKSGITKTQHEIAKVVEAHAEERIGARGNFAENHRPVRGGAEIAFEAAKDGKFIAFSVDLDHGNFREAVLLDVIVKAN